MRLWLRWLACLALSLMLWTVTVESTHNHPDQTAASSCTICVAAHTANPAPSSSDATPVFATIGLLREDAPVVEAHLDFSDLDIRGPPVL
jgi:hypothetical protein